MTAVRAPSSTDPSRVSKPRVAQAGTGRGRLRRFRILAAGENAEVEDRLEQSIRCGRSLAYLYWITILSIAFLGYTKPF